MTRISIRKIDRYFNNENGLTLIEILASIVILSIIVVTFLTFFINSARTTNVSADVIDASYLAQKEMEKFYHYSITTDYEAMVDDLIDDPDFDSSINGTEHQFIKREQGYRIEIRTNQAYDQSGNPISDLYQLLIRIYDDQSGTKKAQVETKLLFDE